MIMFCVSIFRPNTNTMFLILLVPNTVQSLTHWVCFSLDFFLSLELTLRCYDVHLQWQNALFMLPAPTLTAHHHQAAPMPSVWWAPSRTTPPPAAAGSCLYLPLFGVKWNVRVLLLSFWVVEGGGGFSMWQHWRVLDSFVWCTCVLLMYALQQRTVGEGKDTEGALQDLKGDEDALSFGKKEVKHPQHAQIRAAVC